MKIIRSKEAYYGVFCHFLVETQEDEELLMKIKNAIENYTSIEDTKEATNVHNRTEENVVRLQLQRVPVRYARVALTSQLSQTTSDYKKNTLNEEEDNISIITTESIDDVNCSRESLTCLTRSENNISSTKLPVKQSSLADSAYSSGESLNLWSNEMNQKNSSDDSVAYVPVSFANTVVKKRKLRLRRFSSDAGGDYYFCRTSSSPKSNSLKNLIHTLKRQDSKRSLGGEKELNQNKTRREKVLSMSFRSSVKRILKRIRQRTISRKDQNGLWVRSWSAPNNLDRISNCGYSMLNKQ